MTKFKNVDEYIIVFPEETRKNFGTNSGDCQKSCTRSRGINKLWNAFIQNRMEGCSILQHLKIISGSTE